MTNEARKARNKDIALLARVLYTMQDVYVTEQKRQWMQDRLWNMTQKLTGMPGGHGGAQGLDAKFANISELEERYGKECEQSTRELETAEAILDGIPYTEMKTFVTMKYVLHMGRRDILSRLNMRRWLYDKLCERIEQAERMALVQWPEEVLLSSENVTE